MKNAQKALQMMQQKWLSSQTALRAQVMASRRGVAQVLVNLLYGRKMHVSPFHSSTIAGCVVLWYFEGNTRRFIMLRDKNDQNRARFLSCLDAGNYESVPQALLQGLRKIAGEPFTKSLNKRLLDIDRVACAPSFKYEDTVTGKKLPIQALVWVLQVTAEQAQLCITSHKGLEVITMPEYALLGQDITPSHRSIYQACMRHIHGQKKERNQEVFRELEELLKGAENPQRVVH